MYPEIIKGLFKEEVRVSMVYANNFGFIAKYHYYSEAVLIRMLTGLKKYLKYFEWLFIHLYMSISMSSFSNTASYW